MAKEYAGIRNDYKRGVLDIDQLTSNPFELFEQWMQEAIEEQVKEPTAMALSTVSPDGMPSVRTVLMKGFTEAGFVFYTNYNSKKGKHIAMTPKVAALFFWPELERQVRIEGEIVVIDSLDSDEYFDSRPQESKISAIISPQSYPVPSRNYLEELADAYRTIPEHELERPAYWGGYCIVPQSIEFWQGRPGRLHDRVLYCMDQNQEGAWTKDLLAP